MRPDYGARRMRRIITVRFDDTHHARTVEFWDATNRHEPSRTLRELRTHRNAHHRRAPRAPCIYRCTVRGACGTGSFRGEELSCSGFAKTNVVETLKFLCCSYA